MATVLTREFYNVARTDKFKISPIGDIHMGAAACDEKALKAVIKKVAQEDNHYWIGMGDYGDFINMKDPRFSVTNLSEWITRDEMVDIAKAQRNRILKFFEPIAHKCLGLMCGNHETSVARYYERDVYGEIISGIKEAGNFDPEHRLGLGYYGWIILKFYSSKKKNAKGGMVAVKFNLHHGFVGGKLAGAKALNMQRWLWSHECDVAIFGHSHNVSAQPEAVEWVDKHGNIKTQVRKGLYAGSFLKTVNDNKKGVSTYSEIKGFFPLPHGVVPHVKLRPRALNEMDRIRIET